jgi:hypothetical protein
MIDRWQAIGAGFGREPAGQKRKTGVRKTRFPVTPAEAGVGKNLAHMARTAAGVGAAAFEAMVERTRELMRAGRAIIVDPGRRQASERRCPPR